VDRDATRAEDLAAAQAYSPFEVTGDKLVYSLHMGPAATHFRTI
jgi:hypothetical protein